MQKVGSAEFKARCPAVVDHVSQSGRAVVITKHGKPVVKVVPISEDEDAIFGALAGIARVTGDIETAERRVSGAWIKVGSNEMILLDKHMLVWMLVAPEKLSAEAKKAIRAARRAGAAGGIETGRGSIPGYRERKINGL
jgi:prevent-host-death family protein